MASRGIVDLNDAVTARAKESTDFSHLLHLANVSLSFSLLGVFLFKNSNNNLLVPAFSSIEASCYCSQVKERLSAHKFLRLSTRTGHVDILSMSGWADEAQSIELVELNYNLAQLAQARIGPKALPSRLRWWLFAFF